VSPPPACAGSLVADATALAYGPNDPAASGVVRTAVRTQLACQNQIGRGVASYVGLKLRSLIQGIDPALAEQRARRQLDRIPVRCLVDVAESNGVLVPAVGEQAAAAVGGAGSSVDPIALRDALLALLGVWVDRVAPNAAPLRPNIVLIVTDDQRADTIAPQFMPLLSAELISSGLRFANGFAPNAVCCPSRASILSGQYARNHGVLQNREGDPANPTGSISAFDDTETLATALKAAGYRTGLFGKYLNGYRNFSDDHAASHGGLQYVPPGWDRWYAIRGGRNWGINFSDETGAIVQTDPGTCIDPPPGEECPTTQAPDCPHSTDHLRDKALDFIDEATGLGQRFFLYLSTQTPHGPACPAIRHQGMFAGVAPHRPPSYKEGEPGFDPDDDKPQWVRQQQPFDGDESDEFRIRQLESLQTVDEAVQAVMAKLRETGQERDTIVVYYGDNGYLWGEHRRGKKACPYEECWKVPFVVRYPRLVPLPRSEDALVANIDLAPTLLELAGATSSLAIDGRSMVRLLDGTEAAWRDAILGEHWGSQAPPQNPTPPVPTFAVVREAVWKYTEYCTGERELYDLSQDPFELTNVVAANPQVAADMAARLRTLNEEWPATIPFACGVFDDGEDED
jgi:arylsulfatase A-like enzyme